MIEKVQFKKIYTCSICKKEFEWGEDSQWYGRIENNVIIITCSQACKEKSGLKDE